MNKLLCWLCFAVCIALVAPYAMRYIPKQAPSRDYIHVVSSKRAFPFGTAVAEQLAKYANFRVPLVESGSPDERLIGSFCAGIGLEYPDILLPARRMTAEEFVACRTNKVVGIVEASFGMMTFGQPFFLYVKSAHTGLVPGMRTYLREFMSLDASGERGYLVPLGLVPLSPDRHLQEVNKARLLKVLTAEDLNSH